MLPRHARSGVALHRRALTSIDATAHLSGHASAAPWVRQYAVSPLASRLLRRRSLRASLPYLTERTLATAVDDFRFDSIPYNHLNASQIPLFPSSGATVADFRPFDLSEPLITIPEPTPSRTITRTNHSGIPGDADDMLPVFEACIRVGKLERASLVLKRLNAVESLSPELRIMLNNEFLRANLNHLRSSPDRSDAEQLHRWYELQIRSKQLPLTAETIACMLKASLLSERGPRLTRLVRRYMEMAPGEAGLRVLSMADILSDQDLAVITDICPKYNFTPDVDEPDFDIEVEAEGMEETAVINTGSEPLQNMVVSSEVSKSIEDLTPTPQRGDSLDTLKDSLRLLAEFRDVDISKLPEAEQQNIQLQLERDSIGTAISKWRKANDNLRKMGINTALGASSGEGSLSQQMGGWLEAMVTHLKKEFILVEAAEQKENKSRLDLERCIYGPILQQADPSRLAALTILSVLNLSAMTGVDKGVPISKLVNSVAKLAQEDIVLQQKERSQKVRRGRSLKLSNSPKDSKTSNSSMLIGNEDGAGVLMQEAYRKPWSVAIRAQVGSILLKSLIDTSKVKVIVDHPVTKESVTQYQPAFSHRAQPRKGKKVGLLFLNEHLMDHLKREPVGDFLAKHLPMVVEPKPWSRLNEGGFLESKTSLVRVKPGDVEQRLYTKAAIRNGDMKQVFDGLDVLGKTPWMINKDTLQVMMEAWNSGESIANMPPLNPDLQTPPEPDSSIDPLVRSTWMRAVKAIENERSGLHSQRCFMNLQLEIARAFQNQTIYFPHNVDYRGRAYPMPTYLNHMGADHTRAILRFAKGKELGVRGLRWLKIHLANVYGLDKASFDDREAFANENLQNIIESATVPLQGSRWWLKAEDPWQCLSACFELKAAHELDDPTKFVSHLPVQQDGTCNGLQHYAALGGDTWGAKQVNLEPGDKPADVYSAVADLVKQGIAKDLEAGNRFAEILTGKITRKVVKQTVMTNVYGVTFSGAKKQVCKQIDALYPNLGKECGIPNMMLSTYIARHIFTALATMFRGAHDIQYWLGEVGGRVCRALTPAQLQQMANAFEKDGPAIDASGKKQKVQKKGFDELVSQFRSTVVWTTPLRMPVAQPYRKNTTKEIRTCLQALVYPVNDQTDPVNRRKQLQGFPPNFIHSLDASHMLLSALQCDKLGLHFAAVHDSFWTHAGDVDTMNEVIRDAFIQIHEEDVVGRLAAEFKARHRGSLYLAHIDPDTPVGKKIKELRKNSKLTPKEELLLEYKRNTLKMSGSPWDLETAQQIITPASVYEDMSASEEDLEIKEDMKAAGLDELTESSSTDLSNDIYPSAQDADASAAAELADQMIESMQSTPFELSIKQGRTATVKKAKKTPLPVWLPLTIPAIPQKGDFDVRRLRESKYFFS